MTEDEYQQQCSRIQSYIDGWVDALGLRGWVIAYEFCREPLPARETDGWPCLMDCQADWRYLAAHIRLNVPAIAEVDDDRLENALVHEYMHLFINELRGEHTDENEYHDHEERVVTMLARAFVTVRDMTAEAATP